LQFLERILEPPSYGFQQNGKLIVPSREQILREFLSRLNVFKSQKNWLPFWVWLTFAALGVPAVIFIKSYFSWTLLAIGFVYSAVILGSHGTVYLHRYSTHRAFQFKNPYWRFIVRNLVIKIIPEEVYVISHHVHHHFPERPGDPYNAHAGWLYCFLADVNHQLIARHLDEKDYNQLKKLLKHTGVRINSYSQYLSWGSLCHPGYTILHFSLNWSFWYFVFYWIGGHALSTALFGTSFFWAIGVRMFNYDGHGRGKDKRKDGIDFNRDDLSVNQIWPGYVAGEWHNNHHLYPNSARAGFLPYQLDLAWLFIRFYYGIGGIQSYRDNKADFFKYYYEPYLRKQKETINLELGKSLRENV
jgi:stearoyl-CoA desaturase (delta-9 desaturase)